MPRIENSINRKVLVLHRTTLLFIILVNPSSASLLSSNGEILLPNNWLDGGTHGNERLPITLQEYPVEDENHLYPSYGDEEPLDVQPEDDEKMSNNNLEKRALSGDRMSHLFRDRRGFGTDRMSHMFRDRRGFGTDRMSHMFRDRKAFGANRMNHMFRDRKSFGTDRMSHMFRDRRGFGADQRMSHMFRDRKAFGADKMSHLFRDKK